MKPLYCRHLLWRRHYTQPFQESTNVRCQPDGPRLQETWWLFSAVRVVDYSIHHNGGSFKRSVCARQRGNEIILDQHISFDWLPGPIFVRVGRSDGGDWPLYYAECRGGGLIWHGYIAGAVAEYRVPTIRLMSSSIKKHWRRIRAIEPSILPIKKDRLWLTSIGQQGIECYFSAALAPLHSRYLSFTQARTKRHTSKISSLPIAFTLLWKVIDPWFLSNKSARDIHDW